MTKSIATITSAILRPFSALLARVSGLSVKTRIAAIAVIPVVGFIANGVTFVYGEKEVERAFAGTKQAAALAQASHNFEAGLELVQSAAREFSLKPGDTSIKAFNKGHAAALQSLDVVERFIDSDQAKLVPHIRSTVQGLKTDFDALRKSQQTLGLNAKEGVNAQVSKAAADLDKSIEQLGGLSRVEALKFSVSLAKMRGDEREFMLTGSLTTRNDFFAELDAFAKMLGALPVAADAKARLEKGAKAYGEAVRRWVSTQSEIESNVLLIDSDTQDMLPLVDRISQSAKRREAEATAALAASQARTKNSIFGVGSAAVLVCLLFGWWIGRGITRPLKGLASAMKRLAEGDTSARIPATELNDEMGAMARTVLVFRDNAIERERLAQTQAESGRDRERRAETIGAAIAHFERGVGDGLAK